MGQSDVEKETVTPPKVADQPVGIVGDNHPLAQLASARANGSCGTGNDSSLLSPLENHGGKTGKGKAGARVLPKELGKFSDLTTAMGIPGPLTPPDAFTAPREILKDKSGNPYSVPVSNEKLSPGDHTLQFENGRQFVVHVPPNHGQTEMPVMFVIAPSVHTNQGYDAKNFEAETGMNQYADANKFVVVYADDKNHLLGEHSKLPAEAWNAPGSGINDADLKHNGYNDEDYIKTIAALMPKLADVDPSHKDWGALAFSQGGMFLNDLSHKVPDLFPTVGLVGSSFQNGYDYTTAPGNAKNVVLVNLHGDKATLPFPGEESAEYKAEKALAQTVDAATESPSRWFSNALSNGDGSHLAEYLDPLGGIDNRDQNPQRQEDFYIHNLQAVGPVTEETQTLSSPSGSAKKDTIGSYTIPGTNQALHIVDLAAAQHSYPGPDHGSHVNSTPQYTQFDTSKFFSQQFEDYDQSLKKKKPQE